MIGVGQKSLTRVRPGNDRLQYFPDIFVSLLYVRFGPGSRHRLQDHGVTSEPANLTPAPPTGVGSVGVRSPQAHNSLSSFKTAIIIVPISDWTDREGSVPVRSETSNGSATRKSIEFLDHISHI